MGKLILAGDEKGGDECWSMEALELEIRGRPAAKWSLLHCIRSRSCSQLCQGLKLRGKVLIDGRGHYFKCRCPFLPQGPPMLILINPINTKKRENKIWVQKKKVKILPSPIIARAVSSEFAAIPFYSISFSVFLPNARPYIWQVCIILHVTYCHWSTSACFKCCIVVRHLYSS
jgi:hypothetical protein